MYLAQDKRLKKPQYYFELLLKQQKTDLESWVTYTPTLADLNRESRNEYNVPTNVENRATEGSQIREESYLAEESNRGAEDLKIETKANK